jgi:chromosome segregation protein
MDNGAHFHRTDLQVHTPRDRQWKGKRPVDDEARGRYADEFVAACRLRELEAVAITDHHDLLFFDYIREAAERETDPEGKPLPAVSQLVVFPGLELSLAVPCQALLILDADFPGQKLSSLMDLLRIDVADPDAPEHAEIVQVGFDTLPALHDHLAKSKWLAGRFAIFPNVTARGHQTLIRAGLHARYTEMPCVGGYLDGSVDKLGRGPTNILNGDDKTWGNKRIAILQTSDSRSATFEDLGKFSTWIKWAEPTAEALRQACLAQESRISHSEPPVPGVCITEIRVSNCRFLGPINLALNPQYNALIGGRGTGKSTCLEYLRWALCDQPPELSDADDMPNHAVRRSRLIDQTLRPFESTVEVDFLLNGIPHMVRRYAETGRVQLKVGERALEEATPAEIRALLPIEAYSQRQLSSVGVRIDELTRFVTAPIREVLNETSGRLEDTAAQIRENYGHLQRHRRLRGLVSQETLALASLDQQAEKMREKLTGISDKDRQCLAEKPAFDQADALARDWLGVLEEAREEAEDFSASLVRLRDELAPAAVDLPEKDTLDQIESAVLTALDSASKNALAASEGLSRSLGRGNSEIGMARKAWERKAASFRKRYEAATKTSTAHESQLAELRALEERQAGARLSISEKRSELAGLGDPKVEHENLRKEWCKLQGQRTALIEGQCERLGARSSGLIRATVRKGAGTRPLLEPLKAAVSGSSVRGVKLEKLLETVASAPDPLEAWLLAMDELESRVVGTVEDADPEPIQSALMVFGESDIARIIKRLTPEKVLELMLLSLSDQPAFEYRRKEDDYIQFSDASAGQQATALLQVLLSEGGPPLIVDQPEDDLDSQVIEQIVAQIWSAKQRRQLVFSSHNANLVVNGDAELVVCFDYRKAGDHSGGTIKLQGAIDIPKVKERITLIMEGGEKAFKLRKEKYAF